MSKYILSILKTNLNVVWSWGTQNYIAFENGLQFKVNGFIHKGWVIVKYNEGTDLFNISLLNSKMINKNEVEEVYFDELVNVIDGLVERTSNYEERVNNWLNSNAL